MLRLMLHVGGVCDGGGALPVVLIGNDVAFFSFWQAEELFALSKDVLNEALADAMASNCMPRPQYRPGTCRMPIHISNQKE